MRIKTVNIIIRPEASSAAVSAMLRELVTPVAGHAETARPLGNGAPAIGQAWPGHGGIYAGIARGEDGQPDQHLVLAEAVPVSKLNWADAVEWAGKVEVDGHSDFRLPTRFESALLYANVRDSIDVSGWYWTGTQYSDGLAWTQLFDYGTQGDDDKGYEARARAVRRFTA